MGRDRARQRIDQLLSQRDRPRVVVMAGYAGALRTGLTVGDVIIAAEVVDEYGASWPTSWPGKRAGRVVSAQQLVGDSRQKRELGKRLQADAVDMESAAVAEACSNSGVPFGSVRVISDDADTSLSPRLARMLAGGNISPWRVCRELVQSPRIIGEMMRLGRNTTFAGNQLAEALRLLLPDGM